MRPFSAPDVANPERFDRYLSGKWRPAFTDSRRFSLVRGDGSNGELHGEVYVVGERIEVHLHILDGQGQEVAATTVEMYKGLFPPGIIGPDVTRELARCVDLAEARRLGDAKACYEGVRAAAPGDARAIAGVSSGLERIAGIERDLAEATNSVEDAIRQGELGEARDGLKRLRELNAGHPRLAGLEEELVQAEREERLREEAARRERERQRAEEAERQARGEAERKRKADDEAFARAKRLHTASGYREYLSSYPDGRHASRAKQLQALLAPGAKFRDCEGAWCPELVVVPSGSFEMGSPGSEEGRGGDEGPRHEVSIAEPFAVGVYEVTRGEYGRFVSATGHASGDSCYTYESGEWEERSGRGWRNPGFRQTDAHPVLCVSWDDAQAYVRWLSVETGEAYRLLSEAEWEYVARGGTKTARYWGESGTGQCRNANGADASTDFGWRTGCDDGHARTSPVGAFSANRWKLHDVLGNVWEWVEDCWNDSYAGAPSDGSAWESGDCSVRVLRGGSWFNQPRLLRSANRLRDSTGLRDINVGFRVARTLAP